MSLKEFTVIISGLAFAAHEAGFDSLFMYTWRDREVVMDLLEIISGNRVHYAINTIGGVRRDLSEVQKGKILEGIQFLKKRMEYYTNLGTTEPSFVARIAGVGVLPKDRAMELCAVGPTLRASGISSDIRRDDPYAAYDEIPFDVCTADSCDVLGRVVVRVRETIESIKIVEHIIKNLPDGEIKIRAPRKVGEGEVVSRYEAPRGENIHYIRSNGTDKPERLKVRAPTLANYPATIEMLKNGFVADIPLIFAAIDPCICCAERFVELVDERRGNSEILTMAEIKKRYRRNSTTKRTSAWPL